MTHAMLGAGPELDAEIARRVFGHTIVFPMLAENDSGEMIPFIDVGTRDLTGHECPFYSTDISAAWLVVEKLESHGLFVTVDRVSTHWTAQFSTYKADEDRYYIVEDGYDNDSAATAICLAALAALEHISKAKA